MQVFDTFGNPEDQIQRLLIEAPTALNGLVWDANKVSSVQIKYHPYK